MSQIKIEVIPQEEDVPVRGYAIDSGDPKTDKEIEDSILKDLETNPWAWCYIEVKASIGEFEGSAYLGCCSYKDAEDFKKNSGYYPEMKKEAITNLKKTLESAKSSLEILENSIT